MKTITAILFLTSLVMATEPNFVRSTIYKVGKASGADKDLVATSYSDGLGRQLQTKVMIDGTKDRVVCSYFDDAGRPSQVTKTFIDKPYHGQYLSKTLAELLDPSTGVLYKTYNDIYPYSYTNYSDDPLSRVIEQNGPGSAYTTKQVKIWYFGVTGSGDGTYFDSHGFIQTGKLNPHDLTDDDAGTVPRYLSTISASLLKYFLTVTKDGEGHYTQELKDLFGKTQKTYSNPTGSSGDEIVPSYEYDILGNLTQETPPTAASAVDPTKYWYNSLGQLVQKETPDGGLMRYAYTATGQLEYDTSYTSPSGVLVVNRSRKYTYDELDRLVMVLVLSGTEYIPVRLNFYDNTRYLLIKEAEKFGLRKSDILGLENLSGRLVASVAVNMVNGNEHFVTDLFSYDEEGKVKRKVRMTPGMRYPQIITFTYDLQGKVLSENVASGGEAITKNYLYDAEGRLESVSHVQNSKTIAIYHYDTLNRLDTTRLAIVNIDTYKVPRCYNIREGITSILRPPAPPVLKWFEESGLTYTGTGNIESATFTYNTPTSATYTLDYFYDNVNRLTTVDHDGSTEYDASYIYDQVGRFQRKTEGVSVQPTYTYFGQTNRLKLTRGTDVKYLYDRRGNLIYDVSKKMHLEYDCFDMPVAFTFYSAAPAGIGTLPDPDGGCSPEALKTLIDGASVTRLSQVVMLYDASGNRVYKSEVK